MPKKSSKSTGKKTLHQADTTALSKAPGTAQTTSKSGPPSNESSTHTPVGGYVLAAQDVEINAGRPTVTMQVRNTGDRPIQIGSHFHFFEVNRALEFDRAAAFGMRLDIAAGTAIRFEPGDEKQVTLVPFGGKQRLYGFNNLVDGWAPTDALYRPNVVEGIRRAAEYGFKSTSKPK